MTIAYDAPELAAAQHAELCRRLAERLPSVPAGDIREAVGAALVRLDGSRVDQYIPVLVERVVVRELDR